MNKNELKQGLILCITTLCNMNGRMPDPSELYSALGSRYLEVIEEYLAEKNVLSAAA